MWGLLFKMYLKQQPKKQFSSTRRFLSAALLECWPQVGRVVSLPQQIIR